MDTPALGSRALFPELTARAYLAHAAISPLSQPVLIAMASLQRAYASAGAGAFSQSLTIRESCRARIARLIGAEADHIGFVQNTGHGLSAIATALDLRVGERIGLFAGEYPSNVSVFQQVAARAGAGVHFFSAEAFAKAPERALADVETELQRGMRLVSVSAVQFQTGLRMPLAALGGLCTRYGTSLCVDAVQALGAVPIDVDALQIDALACGGHKWMMGAEGAGFLYVRPRLMARFQPLLVGNLSHKDALLMLGGERDELRYDRPLLTTPRVFEGGMQSSVSLAALDASLELIERLGVASIYAHIQRYHDRLEPELVDRGFESMRASHPDQRSAMLSWRPPAGVHAGRLVGSLAQRGVVGSSPDGLLRFAPHWPNHHDELPLVLSAVDEALREQ